MHKKFIHLAFDSIFLDYTINQFEAVFPGRSEYFVDIDTKQTSIKYIKQKKAIRTINFNDLELRMDFINSLNQNNIIIFHCLTDNFIDIINNISKEIPIVWIAWGGEVNSLPKLRRNQLLPKTKKLIIELTKPKCLSNIYERFPNVKYLAFAVKHRKIHSEILKIKAIKRINYAGIFVKEDFDLFNNTYNFNLKWLWYCYYNIEDTAQTHLVKTETRKNNILIGNSADPRNNHIEALELLKNYSLGQSKIICPLSYGTGIKGYVEKVVDKGNELFGDNFIPLVDFLPLQEYNRLVNSCGIAIFNHQIQQAVGNVLTSLWNGSKVFLSEQNPLLKYFLRIGLVIYSINEIILQKDEVLKPLSEKSINNNRLILLKHFSRENVNDKVKELITLFE